MSTFKKNSFIKWSDKDDQGTFSHTGQVISHADGMVVFADKLGGTMGVPEDEGKFKQVRKPKSWTTKRVVGISGTVYELGVATKPTKKAAGNIGRIAMNKAVNKAHKSTKSDGSFTKYHQVVATMSEERPVSRKAAIALVVEVVGMTPAGASTYVAKANKILKLW